MAKGKYESASMNDLLKAADLKREYKNKKVYLDVDCIGRTLEFRTPTDSEFTEFFDSIKDGNADDLVEAYSHLIYNTCAILHDKELHELLEVKDPYDVVLKVFTAQTIFEIGNQLAEKFNISQESMVDELKKPLSEEIPI